MEREREREGQRTPTCNAFLATLDTLLYLVNQPTVHIPLQPSWPCPPPSPPWVTPSSSSRCSCTRCVVISKICCCLLPRQQGKEIGNLILFSCFCCLSRRVLPVRRVLLSETHPPPAGRVTQKLSTPVTLSFLYFLRCHLAPEQFLQKI